MRKLALLVVLLAFAIFPSLAGAVTDYPTAQSPFCNTAYQFCVLETGPELVPNDTYWSMQYGPQITQAPAAWDVWMGAPTLVVAIVDTGIDCTHRDLVRCVPGYDFIHSVPLVGMEVSDDYGHGTHVTGIAAAATNNAEGIAGIAQVSYMPVKVCDSLGTCPDAAIVAGIQWATDHGASIINMSLGGADPGTLSAAVDYAYSRNVLVISACGNASGLYPDCFYPAAAPNSMGVSCTDATDTLCSFSSRGPSVDVSAPGDTIWSTVPTNGCLHCTWYGYAYLSGTSMSTPHVSGVAALIRSQHPELTVDQVWGLLELSADDKGALGYDTLYGFGRVDAYRAVTTAAPPGRCPCGAPPPPPPPPPVCSGHLNPHGKCVGPPTTQH